jgi:hypothetical protein
MAPHGKRFGFGLLLAALALAPAASGAPKASAPKAATATEREAAEHKAAAAKAMKLGDAQTAVRELTLARDLAVSPDILLELARAHRLAGDALQARDTLKTLLSQYETKLSAAKRSEVEAELAQIQARIAVLKLDIPEPGASIAVDGRDVGLSPLSTPIELNTGTHDLSVKKPGFVEQTRKLELAAGNTMVTIMLVRDKATGQLVVTTTAVEPLNLFVNEAQVGSLPFRGDFAPGSYRIEAKGARMKSEPQTVQVELGQVTNVSLSAAMVPGHLRVNAGDAEASIYLDDRLMGRGEWQAEVPPGPHQLRVERPGYEPHAQALEVGPGERVVVDQLPYRSKGTGQTTSYKGIYANIGLLGLFGSGVTNEVANDCPANSTGGACSSSAPAGGGLAMRIGYSLGIVGFEGMLIGGADVVNTSAEYNYGTTEDLGAYYGVPRSEEYAFIRYGFGGGAGARVLSKGELFRFSGALSGLLLWRSAQYARATTANTLIPDATDTTSESETYVAPGLMLDVGVLIGSTPGVKFHAGLLMLVEFTPDPVSVPAEETTLGRYGAGPNEPYGTPEVDVSRGEQVFWGPFLAAQFGH